MNLMKRYESCLDPIPSFNVTSGTVLSPSTHKPLRKTHRNLLKPFQNALSKALFSSHRTPLKAIDLSKPKLRERAPRPKPLKLDLKP